MMTTERMLVSGYMQSSKTPDPHDTSPKINAAVPSGFEAMLALYSNPAKISPVTEDLTTDKTKEAEKITQSSPVGDLSPQGLAMNFTFFVRLSNDFDASKPEITPLFHEASKTIPAVFLNEGGWAGDPIRAFLSKSENALESDSDGGKKFLENLILAVREGMKSTASALGTQDDSLGNQSQLGGENTSLSDILPVLMRPPIKLASGNELKLINSMGSEIAQDATSKDTDGRVSREPGRAEAAKLRDDPRMQDFLEKFLEFIEKFIEETRTADSTQKTNELTSSESPAISVNALGETQQDWETAIEKMI